MLYDIDDTAEVVRWNREFQPAQPEDLSGWIGLITIPPALPFPESLWGRKSCAIVWCYSGPHDRADESLKPVRSFGSPLVDGIQAMPYNMLTTASTPSIPPACTGTGEPTSSRSSPTRPSRSTAPSVSGSRPGTRPCTSTRSMARRRGYRPVPPHSRATAAGPASLLASTRIRRNREAITSWTKDYWEALHPTSAGGAYVNFLMDDEGQDRVKASYRDNYARLAQVKRRYDPHNLFHINQNIRSGD